MGLSLSLSILIKSTYDSMHVVVKLIDAWHTIILQNKSEQNNLYVMTLTNYYPCMNIDTMLILKENDNDKVFWIMDSGLWIMIYCMLLFIIR